MQQCSVLGKSTINHCCRCRCCGHFIGLEAPQIALLLAGFTCPRYSESCLGGCVRALCDRCVCIKRQPLERLWSLSFRLGCSGTISCQTGLSGHTVAVGRSLSRSVLFSRHLRHAQSSRSCVRSGIVLDGFFTPRERYLLCLILTCLDRCSSEEGIIVSTAVESPW